MFGLPLPFEGVAQINIRSFFYVYADDTGSMNYGIKMKIKLFKVNGRKAIKSKK